MGTVYSETGAGLIPGMLLNLLIFHYLKEGKSACFEWRIPCILGGFLCLVAYQIRSKLHETTAFAKVEQHNKFPLAELIHRHLGGVLTATGLVSMMAAPIVLALIFMPTYLVNILHFNPAPISNAILLATIISITDTYVTGLLANRYSLYRFMKYGIVPLLVAAGVCYFLLSKEKFYCSH